MASAALSAANIRLLAQYSTTYWADEASVNGVWVGLLAKAFPGSDGFVLQPEGQGEGGKMRNDILVRKITNFKTGSQDAYLVFEGKSSKGDNLDQAAKQLLDFVKASPKLSGVQKLWGIVARGTEFRLLFYLNGTEYKLKLPKPNSANPDSGKPSRGAVNPDYTLAKAYNEAGSIESVELFLAYAMTNFIP
ncbi:hypothetical protein BCON_1022g00010 [Botryotinia convoluta]|uniref:Uncharacterized protein n=1 Tax=Botryotinia convoluta TaxID=54673 RepID=A0A4Z1H3F2_9HELO|nr:hypothetical protein BCON_1022g00010 [Botryotinia convoluta]